MAESTEADAIIEIARESADPTILDISPEKVAVVAHVCGAGAVTLETVDLESHLPAPRRKKGHRRLTEAASLVAYVNEHLGSGTHLYGNAEHFHIKAVVNDHGPTDAGWGDHTATLSVKRTLEWARWKALDGQYVNQVTFAEHIEDSLREIMSPDGSDLLEMVQTFHATTKVAFQSENRLANGQRQLVWQEEIDAKAGLKGQHTFPERLTLGIVVFDGMEAVEIDARLRFRIKEGTLAIGFKLDRPEQVERDCFATVCGVVQAGTGLTPLMSAD